MSDTEWDRRINRMKLIEHAAFGFLSGVLFVIAISFVLTSPDKDNTDPIDGRSRLRLHTDCLTGLQYLSAIGGGITPRLDVNGKHIIDRSECGA